MKHLVVMAAGTGGHVIPGLAVAREMLARGFTTVQDMGAVDYSSVELRDAIKHFAERRHIARPRAANNSIAQRQSRHRRQPQRHALIDAHAAQIEELRALASAGLYALCHATPCRSFRIVERSLVDNGN